MGMEVNVLSRLATQLYINHLVQKNAHERDLNSQRRTTESQHIEIPHLKTHMAACVVVGKSWDTVFLQCVI